MLAVILLVVIGHELSHIKNYDIRLLLIGSTLIGMAGLLANLVWRSAFFMRPRGYAWLCPGVVRSWLMSAGCDHMAGAEHPELDTDLQVAGRPRRLSVFRPVAELLVISAPDHGSFAGALIGSVSHHCAH